MTLNNKGAIELSLNLVIYLIIGLTILGLVISYVVNSLSTENIPQIPENDLKKEQICGCSDNFCVGPDNINLKKGENEIIYIKARAIVDEINCLPGEIGGCEIEYEISNSDGEKISSDLSKITGPGFSLNSGDQECNPFQLSVDKKLDIGIYYLSMVFYPNTDSQLRKVITFEVN